MDSVQSALVVLGLRRVRALTMTVATANQMKAELLDCEKQSLGMDHCGAGRLLAAQWNLPEELPIVASRHHDPQGNYELDLLTLVHLGCRLADSLGFWS